MKINKSAGIDLLVHVNGTQICYDDYGMGTIPVIFIHGFPFKKSSWLPQMSYLKESHRVIAYDIRGFGRSVAGTDRMSIDLFADDLVAFMDALKIDKAIVCGLSMGGYILLNALNRYPNKFISVILSDTQCIADSKESIEKRQYEISRLQAGKLSDFAQNMVAGLFTQDTIETNKVLVKEIYDTIVDTGTSTIIAALKAIAGRREECSLLSEIRIPVLVICGREDKLTSVDQSEFMHTCLVNSKFIILEHAGHLSNLEQPAEFNRHISEFLTSL